MNTGKKYRPNCRTDELLKSGSDKVVNNQFKFGAGKKELKDFDKSLTNIGINKKGKDDLISVLTKAETLLM